jgi:hypothetical protein
MPVLDSFEGLGARTTEEPAMHSRTTAAAAALLLAASLTGTTLGTGSADAATGQATRDSATTASRAMGPVVVDVAVHPKRVTRSRTGFRPGYTMFHVRSAGGTGSVEVLRLRHGYTVKMLTKDFGGLFNGDLHAIRRIDRKVVFYGGTFVEKGEHPAFATWLDAGRYLVANLDKGTFTWRRVAGRPQHRTHPVATGRLNLYPDDRISAPVPNQHSGWMRSTNKTDEPHFIDLQHVKWTTTNKKVRKYFESGAQEMPPWALPEHAGTLVISPGHTVWWRYDLPRGKYLAACWWPSDEDGMPHALMGMWRLTKLK